MKFSILIILLFIVFVPSSFCQFPGYYPGIVPPLSYQQSPFLQGAGVTGVAIVTDDPIGYYYNPAILGVTAKSNHISALFLTKKTEWLGLSYISTISYGFNAGYNLSEKLPVSVGFGFLHNIYTFDNNSLSIEKDSFNSFSLGVSINLPIEVSFGLSIKKFDSYYFGYSAGDGLINNEISGTAYDIGGIVILPFSDLLLNKTRINIYSNSFLFPKINFTMGYSMANIGGEYSYMEGGQPQPLPRTAKLGYALNLGANLFINDKNITAFDYTFVAEASDVLWRFDSNNNISYNGFLGDINLGKNLIQLKYTDHVVIHKAHIFNIFETVKFAFGNYFGETYVYARSTSALMISTKGIFKLLNNQIHDPVFRYISQHIGIEYTHSNIFKENPFETDYNAISLFFNNFEL